MHPRHSLTFKILATGSLFLCIALASIALPLWISWQLEGGAAAVNEAGRLRMLTYRTALAPQPSSAAPASGPLAEPMAAIECSNSCASATRPGRCSFPTTPARATNWNGSPSAGGCGGTPGTPASRSRRSPRSTPGSAMSSASSPPSKRLAYWTGLLRAVQLTMVGLAIVSAVLLYASHLMVLEPLRQLGDGMNAIRRGNFAARVTVRSVDEFGELAEGFNAMAVRLGSLYGDLEARVAEKTMRMEVKRDRLVVGRGAGKLRLHRLGGTDQGPGLVPAVKAVAVIP